MSTAVYHNQGFPSPAPVAFAVDEVSSFQRLGFGVLLVFIFLDFSRIFDVKFGYLHITGTSYRVVFAMVLLSRAFQVALQSSIGKALTGFTVWFGLSVPFSIWRGGSKDIFFNQWLMFAFLSYLAVSGLVFNYDQWVKVFKTLAWALLVFTLIANIFGSSDNGRLFLPQGKFGNPNEMAQALLLGLPLWGALAATAKSLPGKAFAAASVVLILATTFRTGSRGAMIAFLVTVVVVFLRASIMGKLKIILAGFLFMLMVTATMPGKLVARYKSVTDDEVDTTEMDTAMATSAIGSTESRKVLLRHSILFTIQHPIFGLGAGNFPLADDTYSKTLGMRKGNWLGTHNSYTQVSSELGIPALLFFVAAIGFSLKVPYSLYKKTRGDPRLAQMGTLALSLHYCLVIYAVTVLFEHIAYTVMLPVFGGMCASLARTAAVEVERIQATPLPVTMAPDLFHTYLARRPAADAMAGRNAGAPVSGPE